MKELSSAKVAEDGAGKQGLNRFETAESADDNDVAVRRCAAELQRIAGAWEDRSHAVKLLQALCDLIERQPERVHPDLDAENWGFLAMEIGEAMRRFTGVESAEGWATDPEKAKGRMNHHWPKLEKIWARKKPGIVERLNDVGIQLVPVLDRIEGGGKGKSSRYGIRFTTSDGHVADAPPVPDIDLREVPPVRYFTDDLSSNRLLRWLSNQGIYLGGWSAKVYFGVFLLLIAFLAITLWRVFAAMSAAPTSVIFLRGGLAIFFTVLIGYVLFGWQVRLAANRVAFVPMLLQLASRYNDYLLELRPPEDKELNGIYLVRYVGDCPICGEKGRGKVHVASGRIEFFGRLVGRCRLAPNAHVFSFDHVSKRGRFLR